MSRRTSAPAPPEASRRRGTARPGLSRRRFSAALPALAAAASAAVSGGASAAPAAARPVRGQEPPPRFVHGVNYVRLVQRAPVSGGGKIDVVEFFWYECPHCNAFEPALEAWEKRLPADVTLRRVPVYFAEVPYAAQQRLYYTFEAMGLLPVLHRKVFRAIHVDRMRLRTPQDFSAFIAANGVDPTAFAAAWNSQPVQANVLLARQLAAAYKIDAVPALGVAGRWYTTGGLANANAPAGSIGSNARMLDVVDHLLPKARQRS